MVRSKDELHEHTEQSMNYLSDKPDHIKSFFDYPALEEYKLD